MASKDPYTTLGVAKSASADEIKTAFRNLAKKYHPDKTKGDKSAEVKFKEINTANDILSDPVKRKKFDRGELDAEGNERSGFANAGSGPWGGNASDAGFRDFNFGGARGANNAGAGFGGFSAEDIFSDLFGSRGGNTKSRTSGFGNGGFGGFGGSPKGEDIKYDLTVTLIEAARGGKRRIKLPHGKEIDVTIPAATVDGQTLRLKGMGAPSRGGTSGDALVSLHIEPHKLFTLKGTNIYVDVPVTLYEAVLGGTINVPTLDGPVTVKVPKGSNTGTQLRLKGKGAAAKSGTPGDQYCTLKVTLPETPDDDLANLVEKWAKKHHYDPRKKLV